MSSPSLASATGTRVDSASKHIIPCKVHTDFMASLVPEMSSGDAMRELEMNKHKYCMAKDDIVVGLGRALYASSINSTKRKAYPAVITTLGGMNVIARRWHSVHNFACCGYATMDAHMDVLVKVLRGNTQIMETLGLEDEQNALGRLKTSSHTSNVGAVINQIKDMMDVYFMGVALGTAWASPQSGDTVGSVMIGGLRTILNGGFQVSTGDLLMFYWPDERVLFEDDGGRISRDSLCGVLGDLDWIKVSDFLLDGKINNKAMTSEPTGLDKLRQTYYGQGNGNYGGKNQGKTMVAMIKPYIVSRHLSIDGLMEHFPCDKSRIFGRAISNARPYEMLDVMIGRQSL